MDLQRRTALCVSYRLQTQSSRLFLMSPLAGNLAFPLLLVAGLFLLSRQSQGGMGGPGNPNNPLSFGKSRARFQMEANTGVTFTDVAGVDEAKQDFMEVRTRVHPCARPSCMQFESNVIVPVSCGHSGTDGQANEPLLWKYYRLGWGGVGRTGGWGRRLLLCEVLSVCRTGTG